MEAANSSEMLLPTYYYYLPTYIPTTHTPNNGNLQKQTKPLIGKSQRKEQLRSIYLNGKTILKWIFRHTHYEIVNGSEQFQKRFQWWTSAFMIT